MDGTLELDSEDSRHIVNRYAGLNHRHVHGLCYLYRLLFSDDNWVEIGDGKEAVFTNLPAGKFTFEVQAIAPPLDWANMPEGNQTHQLHPDACLVATHKRTKGALLMADLALLGLVPLSDH